MTSFRQSPTKLGFVIATAVFAALLLGASGLLCAYLPGLWSTLGVSLFAPLALAAVVVAVKAGQSLSRPAKLEADETGLSFTQAGSDTARRFFWREIAGVIVFSPTSRFRSPGLELKEPVNGRRFVSFGRFWQASPEEIVEALETLRIGETDSSA
ncbi:hypothetical protein FHS83_002616 [Rhizomicrobium palustre]|uniref:DUF2244 domain-containing protein n=1 Tax=Rhizomicrobium palustre TaxID=189966 RepID=A0A846N097_9PROT|nr:hypothetical protein [Rhizomicrobium palustre]NIK89298.1 hypothetical protein [Rhizomicrobium palustre]